ncbi:fimbrial biogenesis chaperone [Stenotrophomonas mori]|uniref:Molecular chaperone n=1 Tax=Stenotrophomonas mori TaxID=2871096 RepID=A0ABT0SKX2_9GAMM|nr:molecular chaperone [Stenotrophomonas mori]MCL7715564.1 molecular chaperone [Stenotrophomonas mori]
MNTHRILRNACLACLAATAMFHGGQAQASIALSGTRMILQEKRQEATIVVRNSDTPVLVQTWLETHSAGDADDLPFAVTPPLARMPANGQQLLRVMYAGGDNALPAGRESVMWLNVQEVPQAVPGENQLQIAVRQRIKVFFRPTGLSGIAADAPAAVRWSAQGNAKGALLTLSNPTAYHVSFSELADAAGRELPSPGMLAPGQTLTLQVDGIAADAALAFKTINDYGGADAYRLRLSGATEVGGTAESAAR